MINVVLNKKQILKFLIVILCFVFIILFITKKNIFKTNNLNTFMQNKGKMFSETIASETFSSCIDLTIPAIQTLEEKENIVVENKSLSSRGTYKRLINLEIAMINNTEENKQENKIVENVIDEIVENEVLVSTEVPKELDAGPTTVVEENNIATKYTNTYKSVQIKNESKYDLTEEILTPNITLENKKKIILYSTHTCESYTKTDKEIYEESGTYRTLDLNYNVVNVGRNFKKNLESFGYNVIQSEEYHDYPAYTGSYERSLKTVTHMLQENEGAEIVFDIHRDAVGSNSNYAPTVKIGDEQVAQIMFVIGTNGGGLDHPNWHENLKFAVKIQEKANELYPGLFRPIILRNSRYNQNVAKAATIIEVGATGNTTAQVEASTKYLAKILDEVLK